MANWGDWIQDKGVKTKYFPVHEGQLAVLQSTARYTAAIAGSGGGKTACGALWLLNELKQKPAGKFLIVAPSYHIFRSATQVRWEETISGYKPLEAVYSPAYHEYKLPCGATIYCRSADNPTSFEGIQANGAWFDEGGKCPVSAWDAVKRRTNYHKGRVLITTTPYNHGWLYKDVYQKWKEGNKDYCVVQFPSNLNPTFDNEEFARLEKSEAAHKFAMFYEGQFMKAEGLVYPSLEHCIVEAPKQLPQGRLVGGLDFGFNDPFAGLAGVLDSDNVLWLFFERYVRQQTIDQHAKHLPAGVTWYCDSARPDSIKDLRRLGHSAKPCRKTAGSIQHGISLVHSRINSGRLKLIKGLTPNLLAEAELYHYPDKDEETYGDLPVDEDNHALDALRYLISSLDKKRLFG